MSKADEKERQMYLQALEDGRRKEKKKEKRKKDKNEIKS